MTASLRSSALANRSAGVRCAKGSSVTSTGAPSPEGGFATACAVPLSAGLDLTARGLPTRLSRGLSRRVSVSSMNSRSPLHAAEVIRPGFPHRHNDANRQCIRRSRRSTAANREKRRLSNDVLSVFAPGMATECHLPSRCTRPVWCSVSTRWGWSFSSGRDLQAQPSITGALKAQKWLRWLSCTVQAIPMTMPVTLPDHRDTPDRQQGQKPEDVDDYTGDRHDAADHNEAAEEDLKHLHVWRSLGRSQPHRSDDIRQFFKRTFGSTRAACRAGCQVAMSARRVVAKPLQQYVMARRSLRSPTVWKSHTHDRSPRLSGDFGATITADNPF